MVKGIKPGHPIWEEVWEKSRPGDGYVSHLDQIFQAKLQLNEALTLLTDIYNHLIGGAPLYPGSLIFEEDRPAVDVIGNFLRKTEAINARP